MGKKIRDEDLVMNIVVNGDNGKKEMNELDRSVKDLTHDVGLLAKQEKALAKAGKENTKEYRETKKALDAKNKAIEVAENRLIQLRKGLDINKMSYVDLRKEMNRITRLRNLATPSTEDWKRHDRQLQIVKQRYKEVQAESRVTTGSLRTMGGQITSFMGSVAGGAALIYGAFRVFSNASKIVMDFEQANAQLASVLGVNRSEVKDLEKDAKRLGATTSKTASEVVSLQIAYAKLGFTQAEILNVTAPTLALAEATLNDLDETATIVGATLRGFGLSSSQTTRVVDVMAKSFSSSGLDMQKFGTAMSLVAPVAATTGASVESVTSQLGILVDRGLDASTAGTSLRNIFLQLSAQGITWEQAQQKINSATDKGAVAMELFGTRGATTAVILAQNADQLENLEEKLLNAGGAAQEMAEKQLDTMRGKLQLLNSAWEGFILSLEDGQGSIQRLARWTVSFATESLTQLTSVADRWALVTKGIKNADEASLEYLLTQGKMSDLSMFDTILKWISPIGLGLKRLATDTDTLAEKLKKAFGDQSLEDFIKYQTTSFKTFEAVLKKEGMSAEEISKLWTVYFKEKKKKYENDLIANQEAIAAKQTAEEESAIIEAERLRKQAAERAEMRRKEQEKIDNYHSEVLSTALSAIEKETEAYKDRLIKAGIHGKMMSQLTDKEKQVLLIINQQHKANLAKIDTDAMSAEIKRYEDSFQSQMARLKTHHNEELSAFNGNKEDRENLIKEQTTREEELVKANLAQLQSLIELTLDKGSWTGITADDVLSDQEYTMLKSKLEELGLKLSEIGLKKSDDPVDKVEELGFKGATRDVLGFAPEDWEMFFSNLEYSEAGMQKMTMALSVLSNAYAIHADAVSEIERAKFDNFQRQNNLERQKIREKMDYELQRAQGNAQMQRGIRHKYNAQITQLDAELDRKKAQFDYNQAKRSRNVALMSAIVNTANGITAALADANIPLSILIGALGAFQVGTIAMTELPEIPGREEGGFMVQRQQDGRRFNARYRPDQRGYVDRPTVITGESGREFVASDQAVTNPTIRPVLDLIDTAQRNGTISALNLQRMLNDRPSARFPGRQAGGYMVDTSVSPASPSSDPELKRLIKENSSINAALLNELRKGLRASVSLLGPGGFTEAEEEKSLIDKNVNL